jgi:Undecaprenyl-phosphate galactose phosphotransferase WbaP
LNKRLLCFAALVAADFIAFILSLTLAFYLRRFILPLIYPRLSATFPLAYYLSHGFIFLLWLLVFAHEKLYTRRSPLWDEIRSLWKCTTLCFAFIMILVFLARREFFFSRAIIILAWFLSLIIFPLLRFLTKFLLLKAGLWQKDVLILGDGDTTRLVIEGLARNRIMGFEVKGVLIDNPEIKEELIAGTKVLGKIDELEYWSRRLNIRDIILAISNASNQRIIELIKRGEEIAETIRIIPPTLDLITVGVDVDNLGTTLALSLKRNLDKKANLVLKMIFEYFLCIGLVILSAPLMLLIALSIKLDSKGPVFFVQRRLGKNGRPFSMLKFRTMVINADKILEEHLASHPEARKQWELYKKIKGFDPRLTRVGRILRRFSLDELPQLFNILKGEMNLVGPRPYLEEEITGLASFFRSISKFRPGITGLWQISGRSDLPLEKRMILDEYYLRNWSLWLDFMILVRTIKAVISGQGAY